MIRIERITTAQFRNSNCKYSSSMQRLTEQPLIAINSASYIHAITYRTWAVALAVEQPSRLHDAGTFSQIKTIFCILR